MSSDKKFFFEEDPQSESSGVSWKEHSEAFFEVLKDAGVVKQESMAPMGAAIDQEMKKKVGTLVEIEYGVSQGNYAIHVAPRGRALRLMAMQKVLKAVLMSAVQTLNEVVPFDLQVDIFLPDDQWEIKAISFVIKSGADAWNLDRTKIEAETIDKLLASLSTLLAGVKG